MLLVVADTQPVTCRLCAASMFVQLWSKSHQARTPPSLTPASHPTHPSCSEAAAAGCTVVTGETMFVGQAADQFRLFTGKEPPVELMRRVVLESLGA